MRTRPLLVTLTLAVVLTVMAALSPPAGAAAAAPPPPAAGQPPGVSHGGLAEILRDIVGDLFFGRHHGDRHGHRHGDEGDVEGDDEGGHRHHHDGHHDDATFQAALIGPGGVGHLTAMGLRDDDSGFRGFVDSVLQEVVAGVDDVTEITDVASDLVDFLFCQYTGFHGHGCS